MPDRVAELGHGGAASPGGAPPAKLTTCPDCGHWVSLRAIMCPACGRPFRELARAKTDGPFVRTLNAGCLTVLGLLGVTLALTVMSGAMGALGELLKWLHHR